MQFETVATVQSAESIHSRSESSHFCPKVGLLRKATNGLPKLWVENRQLRFRQATVRAQGKPNLAAGDLVPIASLMFAGYATPEATLQSTLSAFSKGDLKYLDGFTPKRRKKEREDFTGKSESEIAAIVAKNSAKLAGARFHTTLAGGVRLLYMLLAFRATWFSTRMNLTLVWSRISRTASM